jgi:tetratricopeptide (TPR) repeat protein
MKNALSLTSLLLFLSAATSALSQTDENWHRCEDHEHPQISIAGCSAVIAAQTQSAGAHNPSNSAPIVPLFLERFEYLSARLNRAAAYSQTKQFELALRDYNDIIAFDRTDAGAFESRGATYRMMHRYDLATADYDYAISLIPDGQARARAQAYEGRARVFAEKGDEMVGWHRAQPGSTAMLEYRRAIEDYDRAIRLDPTEYWYYSERGRVYESTEQLDNAISDYTDIIKLAPAQFPLISYGAYERRGIVYVDKMSAEILANREAAALVDYDRALDDFNEAIKINPNQPVAYFDRAQAKRLMGDSQGAEADDATAMRLSKQLQ